MHVLNLSDPCYLANKSSVTFVAIGGGNLSGAYTEDGGITWKNSVVSNQYRNWEKLAYGNGVIVALPYVGDGSYAISYNGRNWIQKSLPGNREVLGSLAFVGNYFIVASMQSEDPGHDSAISGLVSTDGINWISSGNFSDSLGRANFAYGNGVYVATPSIDYAANHFDVSRNGFNWSSSTGTLPLSVYDRIVFGNGFFLAFSSPGDMVVKSYDGNAWITGKLPVDNYWDAVVFDGEKFVALPYEQSTGFYSKDGFNWTPFAIGMAGEWKQLIYKNGYYAANTWGGDTVTVSNNMVNWVQKTMPLMNECSAIVAI